MRFTVRILGAEVLAVELGIGPDPELLELVEVDDAPFGFDTPTT